MTRSAEAFGHRPALPAERQARVFRRAHPSFD